MHYFAKKSLVVALKDRLNIPQKLSHPAKTVLKIDSCSGWGCTSCPGVALTHFFCKLGLKFFSPPWGAGPPTAPRLRLCKYNDNDDDDDDDDNNDVHYYNHSVFSAVSLEQIDMSDQVTQLEHRATLTGEPGLRQMMYRTQRSSDAVRFTAGDDTKRLACTATVSDIGSAVAITRLLVHRQ